MGSLSRVIHAIRAQSVTRLVIITCANDKRARRLISLSFSYVPFAMKTLSRVGTWILTHPRLVTALAFTALVVAASVLMPAGIARPRWKP